MGRIKQFVERHPQLFRPMVAEHIHPHDHLMARTVLRLFPATVTPNEVTMFRILATPAVFFLILYDHLYIGIIAFVVVAFTDAIDGSLARTRNLITEFGILFDPLADKFLVGSMVLLLVFQHFSFWLGFAILGIEIIFIVSALVAKYKFKTVRMANIWGKVKMILQVTAVFVTLLALLFAEPVFMTIAAGLFGLAIGAAVISLFAHGV